MKKILLSIGLISSLFSTNLNFYCGITMADGMQHLSNEFEKTHPNIHINITKGGSGSLFKKLIAKKNIDLYLPGKDSFINKHKDIFIYTKKIGYNKAVMIVQKGNPKHIKNLDDFLRNDIKVILGNSNKGSIGKMTKNIFIKYGGEEFFIKVYKKAKVVPTSAEIMNAFKNKDTDLSINWKAAVYKGDNREFVDIINIPYIAPKRKLILAVTKFSQHPKIAKEFVDFVFKHKSYLKSIGF